MTRSTSLPAVLGSLLLAASSFGACASEAPQDDCQDGKCDAKGAALELCAAVRGNGQLITAHFASLARIVEHYGRIDGAAGGSSGSITIFMTEAMQANGATSECYGGTCDEAEQDARVALLLKSFPGYVQHLSTTEEAAAVGQLLPIVGSIREAGIDGLLDSDVDAGVAALIDILQSDDLRDLVNPELVTLLQSSPNPEKHARDILEGVQKLGDFAADSDIIFIRPGLLSFSGLADKLGRAADFYAGNGPVDAAAMQTFMQNCATPGRGLSWFEVAALPAGDSTCGAHFDSMLGAYRENLTDAAPFQSRLDMPVGNTMSALISTSVLSGASAESWKQARADYSAAEEYSFTPSFEDLSFGYWGAADDLAKVERNEQGYDDLKTAMFESLGTASWREVLSFSPAEPGLARALELPDGSVSFGGWSDLHPTLALRNMGCQNVVYVTRQGEESGFATGVAGLLGMSAEQNSALYDLDENSSYSLSIAESDANFCTDWNNQEAADLVGITLDAYNAPVESSADFFTKSDPSYANVSSALQIRGCSPGAK